MVVMAALIICLMAASLTYTFTYGRYAGGKFDNENSPYGDLIEFVGANQYIVRTPEELIQAIEDGYSNIKIADDAEEPFVIDTGVTDVSANLVLDVNGKTLIRNSRNPMLDVQTNVSVVLIYDSSDEEQGGFYNPVGSALQASGGTLTVGSGNYDDGPKKEEYNEYNGINSNHGTLDTSNSSVTLYARDNAILEDTVGYSVLSAGSRADTKGYGLVNGAQLPKINTRTVPGQNGAQDIVYGNIYLDNGSTLNTNWLPVDTFLLYTIEKDCFVEGNTLYTNAESQTAEDGTEQTVVTGEALTVACDVASCDFYYYYSIGDDDGDGYENYAVIYGYWDVKALARDDLPEGQTQGDGMATALKDSGLIYPYGAVRMVEGEGFARGGQFSNNFGTVNSYGIYANGGALTASGANFTTGGEGVCIRCEGSASLSIGGGTFSSEIGNTIEMSGGKMTVTKGTFTKNASVEGAASGEGANNGSAIDIQGGTLTMTGSDAKSFTITGSHVNGVRVEGADDTTATATIENATFNFNEGEGSNSVAGVRSFGGTLTVRYSTFNISNGATSGKTITRAAGLSTQGGTVTATTCIFNFAQENATVFPTASAGISSLGGTVTATDSTFTIPGNNNYGIYSSITSGVTGENQYDTKAANCTFTMTGNSNHGIYAAGGKTLASGGTITMIGSGSDRDDNFGIHSTNGITRATGCTITMTGEYVVGVYTTGGRALIEGGSINVGFAKDKNNKLLTSTAVSTEGGEIYLAGELAIESASLGVTVRGNANMSGSLEIASDTITTGDGTTYPDITPGNVAIKTPNATGIYVNNGNLTNKGTVTVTSFVGTTDGADNGWKWVNAEGKPLDSFNKYNGVYVQGGSLVSNGTLNVTFTGVQNDAPAANANGDSLFRTFEIKSYAVRVEGDDSTTVTIASGTILNGTRDTNGTVIAGSGIGGGILVNGGSVTLGSSTSNSGPTVQTTGTGYHHNENNDAAYRYRPAFSKASNWYYYLPSTGGSAVKVDGGTLTVYGGDYSATQGDGIVTVNGMTTINDGRFRGNDNYNTQYENGQPIPQAGPGASYAFKVYGGTAEVYGGTFGGNINNVWSKTSGAFVMGTSDVRGTANIYGGTFEVGGGNNGNEGGQAGFSIYQYATVNFAPQDGKKIFVNGRATAIAIEQTDGNSNSTVTISGGNFASTSKVLDNSDGIWYGNGSTTLNISSGTFTGAKRSGLYFDVHPTSNGVNHVTLSGGTYYGEPDERTYSWGRTGYANGAIGAPMNDSSIFTSKGGLGNEIQLNQIMPDNALAGSYSGRSSDKLCDTVSKESSITITLQ